MNTETTLLTDIVFWTVSVAAILSAIVTVGIGNLFRTALALVATMALLAVDFFLLGADFVGAIQILVNIGAVAIILIFAITLIADLHKNLPVARKLTVSLSLISVGAAAVAIIAALVLGDSAVGARPTEPVAELIGDSLVGVYLGVFGIAAVLVAATTIAALLIVRHAVSKDPTPEEHRE